MEKVNFRHKYTNTVSNTLLYQNLRFLSIQQICNRYNVLLVVQVLMSWSYKWLRRALVNPKIKDVPVHIVNETPVLRHQKSTQRLMSFRTLSYDFSTSHNSELIFEKVFSFREAQNWYQRFSDRKLITRPQNQHCIRLRMPFHFHQSRLLETCMQIQIHLCEAGRGPDGRRVLRNTFP